MARVSSSLTIRTEKRQLQQRLSFFCVVSRTVEFHPRVFQVSTFRGDLERYRFRTLVPFSAEVWNWEGTFLKKSKPVRDSIASMVVT